MATLVIVESPNKVEHVQHALGSGYDVAASIGHIRDLPDDDLGVDLTTFDPTYVVDPDKRAVVARLKSKAAAADGVLLATDPDREGEAISWHLAEVLGLRSPTRLTYNELTEKALKTALSATRPLDRNLVDAQQARRVLDRLVGYPVSRTLSRYFGKNTTAGRVQSATLHLVVARELERERFKPVPYWTLAARYTNGLVARYAALNDAGELVDTRCASQAEADAVAARARGPHTVRAIETKPAERKPKPPFTTSTLQQAASAVLRFKPDHTMALAQKLFEAALITYHRSDSVSLSDDAIALAREFIGRDYPEALPAEPPRYKSKAGAQGAHEAIRPTSLDPDVVAKLAGGEAALYDLIRKRFIACQCRPAVISRTTVTIESGDTTWRASGSVIQFDSFLRYIRDDEDKKPKDGEEAEPRLPAVSVGQVLELVAVDVAGKETKPPPRFTQATLVKEMERTGIGRPATYANTVAVLFAREYVAEEKDYLFPTSRGRLVDEMLGKAFPELLETQMTADMEGRLDQVADGERNWKDELRAWYTPFAAKLTAADAIYSAELARRPELAAAVPAAPKPTGTPCPRCGAELLLRPRKKGGEFLSCSSYPKCDYAADVTAKRSEHACPKCTGPMTEQVGKHGPYARCIKAGCGAFLDLAPAVDEPCPVCAAPMKDKGDFLSCSKYPMCKGSYDKAALAKAKKTRKKCPKCSHLLVEKKGPRGKFLGCAAYPTCRYIEGPSKA
jgi:DNA topoisomerase-1